MATANTIKIYEFSRVFDVTYNQQNEARSGGYENETGNSNYERQTNSDGLIPEVIKEAVDKHLFRIDDNSRPTQNDKALIAREIVNSAEENSTYSVLAVATASVTDKGTRNTIGYRYFWLECKTSDLNENIIDGIYTLLIWWKEKKCPSFELENQGKFLEESSYDATRFPNILSGFKDKTQIQSDFEKITGGNKYPYVSCFDSITDYIDFHYLVWYLHKTNQIDQLIAWAWKVRHLQKPEKFTLIKCADEIAYNDIKKSADSVNSPSNIIKVNVQSSETDPVKGLLLGISKVPIPIDHNSDEIQKLIKKLGEKPLAQWTWGAIVDGTILENQTKGTTKYYALLALLNPNEYVTKWINFLKDDPNHKQTSLKFHEEIYRHVKESKNQEVLTEISSQILREIPEQLKTLIAVQNNNVNDDFFKIQLEYLEYLFETQVWKQEFDKYSENLLYELVQKKRANDFFENQLQHLEYLLETHVWEQEGDKHPKNVLQRLIQETSAMVENPDEFTKSIYEMIDKVNKSSGQKPLMNPRCEKLADLFQKFNKFTLSALFYQLSKGKVPAVVYDQAEFKTKIITLKKDENIEKKKSFLDSISSFRLDLSFIPKTLNQDIPVADVSAKLKPVLSKPRKSHPLVLILVALIPLGVGGFYLWIWLSSQKNANHELALDQKLQAFKTKEDNETKESFLEELKTQGSDSWIKSTFLPDSKSLSPTNQPTSFPVKKGSKPEDIKLLQLQLQLAGYNAQAPDGNWANKTEESINKFLRDHHELKPNQTFDKTTWDKLNQDVTKKAILSVKKSLLTGDLTLPKVQELESCQKKKKMDEFINCVNRLSKP